MARLFLILLAINMDFEEEDLYVGEDEEQGQLELAPQKDEVIMLIDSSKSMLEPKQNDDIPFFMVLQACLGFTKNKILSSESDSIGIILYNTDVAKNHMNFKGIYVLQDLSQPDALRIKELQGILQQKQFIYGHSEALLVEALWLCHDVFSQNKNTANRRILIFTDEDRPNFNKPNEIQRTIQRAKDLAQQDILLELYPLNKNNKAFNFASFYIQIIPVDEQTPDQSLNGFEKLEELVYKMHTKEYKKRRLGTLNFALCPNMTISMNYYCIVKESKKPTPSKVHLKDNKKLKTITSWICQETGKQLWSHEVGNHYEFGGSKVKFTKDDVSFIKNFDVPGMKLMGFKDKSRVKNYMNVRSSYFLYPEESRFKGSSQVVHSLIVSMVKMNKVAIVRLLPRLGSVVRFAALFPSEEPQGFNLVFLPYADDMRSPESILSRNEVQKATEPLVVAAANMISNIQLADFDPNTYYNPVLQHFYTNLEALALEEPKPEPVQDALEPDEEGLQRKENFIKNFFEIAVEGGKKRPPRNDKDAAKTLKNDRYTENQLKKMKVNELKDICDTLGIPKTGKKDEIIERILNN